jgi:hypothetical protein
LATFIGKVELHWWRRWKSTEPLARHDYALLSALFRGSFQMQFHKSIAVLLDIHPCFMNQPHTMSSDTGTSILDEALACIGQRIASVLIQPADKDKNYIISLHNEVVGFS